MTTTSNKRVYFGYVYEEDNKTIFTTKTPIDKEYVKATLTYT